VERAFIVAVLFAGTWLMARLLMPRAIEAGSRLGIINRPGSRGASAEPVPRIGGIGICLAFSAGIAASFSFGVDRFPVEVERVALLMAGGAIVAITMLYDDAVGMRPATKLALQFGAAALVVMPRLRGEGHGIAIDQFNAPFFGETRLSVGLAIAFTIFWFVGMMNTMNWIDGIDGLASSITLVACSVLFLHTFFWPRGDSQFTISILPAVLAAAVFGFLQFNWHPSRLMMGDSGSNFLGFTLAAISIIGGAKLATALLVLGLPVLDVAWVIVSRLRSGDSPFAGDRRHLHHRLLDRGWSQRRIVVFVTGISAIFGTLALILPNREAKLVAFLVLALVLLVTARTVEPASERERRRGRAAAVDRLLR
jgi:UDP-GlcNAc:undecaprenyl-phosphate/decaprenyl-phosphate GlcNAc-1-phosphate transferase